LIGYQLFSHYTNDLWLHLSQTLKLTTKAGQRCYDTKTLKWRHH